MSAADSTWTTRLIAAGCTIVIVVGAFAASGHHSGNGKPKVHPAGPPVASLPPTTPGSARPSHPAKPTPLVTGTASPSVVPSVSPTSMLSTPAAPATPTSAPSVVASPTSVTTPGSPKVPAGTLGAFSYATTGYEQTSIPGTKRTYPKTTTITNTRKGCGVESTWKPVSEHVQSQLLCPSGKSLKISSYKTTISFFGVNSGEDFTCSGDSYLYQPGVAAGHVWKYSCKSADAVAHQDAHVDGYSKMSVGGTSVRVLHVTVDTTLTGADAGKSTQDYWIATKRPVLVKETGTVDATQDSIHYTEAYSLTLDSLTAKS
jgi:hypothetical protein